MAKSDLFFRRLNRLARHFIRPSLKYGAKAPSVAELWISKSTNVGALCALLLGTLSEASGTTPPVFTGLNDVTFLENTVNQSPQIIDGSISLTDPGSNNFIGGSLTITYSAGGGAEDNITIRDQGSGVGQIGASAGIVTYAGAALGTYPTSGVGSGRNGNGLTVTFPTTQATPTSVQALIQNLLYQNSSDSPAASRTIIITVNDGVGGTAAATSTITVTAENDAPTLAPGVFAAGTYTEGDAPVTPNAGAGQDLVITDDSGTQNGPGNENLMHGATVELLHKSTGDTLSFTDQLGIVGTYNGATDVLTLTNTTSAANYQTALRSVTFSTSGSDPTQGGTRNAQIVLTTVFDASDAASNVRITGYTIAGVNNPPLVTAPASIQLGGGATALTGISFSDPDAGSGSVLVTFSVTAGTLSATSGGGVTATGSGTGTLVLSDASIANINTFIAGNNVSCNSPRNSTLTVGINDNANSGSGGEKTASATVSLISTTIAVQSSAGTSGLFIDIGGSTGGGTFGWNFTVGSSPISVTRLGVFDAGSDGLVESHQLGIWDSVGTLITSATIKSGTASSLQAGYRYESITPVVLSANQVYTIGALYGGGSSEGIVFNGTEIYGSGISFQSSKQNALSTTPSFSQPTINAGVDQGVFGPNFQYTLAPIIASADAPANGTYDAAQNLDFTVNFSEAVNVSGGSPSFALTIGSTTRAATYLSGSGSASLIFRYTVASGENDSDGIQVSSPISLNGATIQSVSSGLDATLTFTSPTTTGVRVDAVPPTIVSINRGEGNPTTQASVDYVITFSEPVTGVTAANFTLVASGVAEASITRVSGSGSSWGVDINTGSGDGTVGLNIVNSTGVVDGNGHPLNNLPFSGPTYTVSRPSQFLVASSSSSTAGGALNITVTAANSLGNVFPGYFGTIHFTSSDSQATLPANYTFTAADAGVHTFSVTFRTSGNQTVTVTDTSLSSLTGTSTSVAISAGSATHYSVSAPGSAAAGTAFNGTVTALDAFNNTATAYFGLLHFTSSDSQAVLPANSLLFNGVGTFSFTLKTAGNQTVTATDIVFSSITGTSATISAGPAAASRFVVSLPASVTLNVAFNGTVTAKDPFGNTVPGYAGTVHFTSSDAQAVLPADSTLTSGAGTFSFTSKTTGGQNITAADTTTSSLTGTGNITVNPGATTTVISSSASPSVAGQAVTYTATVSPVSGVETPTGTVIFKDGSATIGTGTLNGSGQAFLNLSSLSVSGSPHLITASYGGDANFTASASLALTQAVNPANTFTTVASVPNSSIFGQPVAFTATVTANSPGAGTPTGTVTFKDGAATIGTGTLNSSGQAILNTSSLSVSGSPHLITASYGGDANFTASASLALTQAVNPANTFTTVASIPNSSIFGQPVAFTATVTANSPGAGTPTGTVTFKDGSATIGTGTLNSSGQAALNISSLSASGSPHSITVSYGGDATFNASTSGALTQTIIPAILSVSGPINGFYKAGTVLSFTVNYSGNVTVTTGGGTPFFALTVGSVTRAASYVSGGGTSALIFSHTVQAGDTAQSGISVASPIQLNGGSIQDAFGNNVSLAFTPPNTAGVVVDTSAPTITISAPSANLTASNVITYTISYGDVNFNASTLAVGDVTLIKTGSASGTLALTGSGPTRTVTISGITGDGTLSISIAAGTATDTAGNSAPAAGPSATFTTDNSPPSIVISAPSRNIAGAGSVTYTITYNDPNFLVSTLTSSNIILNGSGAVRASVSVFTGSGNVRTVEVVPLTGEGTVGISLAPGTARDTLGNVALGAGPSATFVVDTTPPTVSIGSPSTTLTTAGPVSFAITYNGQDTISLSSADVILNRTGSATGLVSVAGSGSVRTVTISGITGNGSLGISLPGGTASDLAANPAPAAGPSALVTIDNAPPTVSISAPSSGITQTGSVSYAVSYSGAGAVTPNLTAANITLNKTGSANGTLIVSGTGSSRIVTITNVRGDGTLGISIAAGTGKDDAGNSALPAGPSATFIVDNTPPIISISAPSPGITKSGAVTFAISASDANFDSNRVTLANILLNKTGTADGTLALSGTGSVRTVTISNITGDGTLSLSIAAGAASDLAGNLAAATGPSPVLSVDNTPPQIVISPPSPAITSTGPITYAITYSDANLDAVSLALSDITLNKSGTANGTLSLSGAGPSRTITISSVTGNGALGISLAPATAQDLAGNLAISTVSSAASIIDGTPPTAFISESSILAARNGPVTFNVVYSEENFAGSTLAAGDVTLNRTGTANGTISVSGTGNARVITVSNIIGDGALGVSIPAGTARYLNGKLAPAAVSRGVVIIDNTPPEVTISAPSLTITTNGPVMYTIFYSEANLVGSSLTPGDITLNKTGTADGNVLVTGNGNIRAVTITNIVGVGTLGISLAAGTATDVVGQIAPAKGPSASFIVGDPVPALRIEKIRDGCVQIMILGVPERAYTLQSLDTSTGHNSAWITRATVTANLLGIGTYEDASTNLTARVYRSTFP